MPPHTPHTASAVRPGRMPGRMPRHELPRTPGANQGPFQRHLTSPPTAAGRVMGASRP